jgi:hypothetical protein
MGTVTLDAQLHVLARGDAYNFIRNGSQHQNNLVVGPLLKKLGIFDKVSCLQFKC